MSNKDIHLLLKELKMKAEDDDVPIMQDEGINFLTNFILKNKINSVLEIGTAVGYSAIVMALTNPNLKITSIERDEERYLEALKNVKAFDLEERITLIFNDALDVSISDKFELIFLDGAKGKNIEFFEKFKKNVSMPGYIITDNISFHGMVEKDENNIKSRNLRGLVRKIKSYIRYLKDNGEYNTKFHDVGDGISVTEINK